jgi:SecD/SecF fusion protein
VSSRKRNLAILGVVAVALTLALLVAIPGSPLSKKTRLGLDLKGGVELVYEAKGTPKVPNPTPAAIADAIETIRKRTDALGVSEPEIQSAGGKQISIGLPSVENPERAEQQVGTTAQLQFYDWEPNLLPPNQQAPERNLFKAVQTASKQKPKAEGVDIPPGGASKKIEDRYNGDKKQIEAYYDRQDDTVGVKYYVFGPGKDTKRKLLRPGQVSGAAQNSTQTNDATAFYETCKEIKDDYEAAKKPTTGASTGAKPAKDTKCPATMAALADAGIGPPAGSIVVQVPRGVLVVKGEKPSGSSKASSSDLGYWVIEDDSELSGSDIEDPKQAFDPQSNEPIVTFDFTDKGRKAFARATKREAERGAEQLLPPGASQQQVESTFQRFAITLDNQLVSLATINYRENPEGIDGSTGAQINGIGTIKDTQDLAESLRIGALPIQLKLISKTQVSATLGKQALNQGLLAGGVGLLLTLTFLVLFYRVLGIVSALALLIYAVLLFALVKLIPITLTLPGIAGLILTLGVAADANIVIFERVKEEARAGRSIPAAISSGYAKALRTIIDANVVTLGVAFILFMLATAGVKGFAFTLLIGTLVSLFTAVLATQAILGSMARTRILRGRLALRIGDKEKVHKFNFMGASKWFFSMSGLILVVGAFAIAGLGINFGIDFESGTRITTPLEKPATVQQVRDVLSPLGYGDAKIQQVKDPELGDNVVQIAAQIPPKRVDAVRQALDNRFGVTEFSNNAIGPTFGQTIARTALIAVIASLILISIYIGMRFEAKFAVPVLIALAHDLLITAGVYALTDREVTTSTVAALLTILGYSLYDTIIVFDRIRENVPRMPRATFSQIVNRSMAEVIVRSLVTSLSTLLPITALMLFGGETLQDFGFALLIGVASGTYSSIFIATPVLTHWKEREPVWKRRERIVAEDHGGVIPAYADVALGSERRIVRDRARTPVAAGAGGVSNGGNEGGAGEAAKPVTRRRPSTTTQVRAKPPEAKAAEPAETAVESADPDTPAPAGETEVQRARREKREAQNRKPRKKHGRR